MMRTNKMDILTDSDFEKMKWHDIKIHAISFNKEVFELYFDIDYINEWLNGDNGTYKFSISPATLIFINVHSLSIETKTMDMRILAVEKINPTKPINAKYVGGKNEYDWIIEVFDGEISFKSTGYKLLERCPPVISNKQELELDERGGISFRV